jgi:hypothetical protein
MQLGCTWNNKSGGSSSSKTGSDGGGKHLAVIIATSVAGGVVFISIFASVVAYLCCLRRKKKSNSDQQIGPADDGDGPQPATVDLHHYDKDRSFLAEKGPPTSSNRSHQKGAVREPEPAA